MTTKTILGLDLGTNSIGWALVKQDFKNKQGEILGMGSRIIPMSQDIIGKFAEGSKISQTAERTGFRGIRRIRERYLLRRERLHRVLNVMGFLPNHFASQIDFENKLGQFKYELEHKLAYNNNEFVFKNAFNEMLTDFSISQPKLLEGGKKVPYDWTIYYLRKKALVEKIEKEELAWILLNFNQKRGYYQLRGEEEEENVNKLVDFHSFKILDVKSDQPQKGKAEIWYSLILENGWIYRRSSKTPLFDWKDKVRDFIVTTDLNDDCTVKTDKEGNEKRSFRAPSADDWTLVKKKTEAEVDKSNKTVGTYIYDTLLLNPNQKINGKLVRTIERRFYKDELEKILKMQKSFHSELQDEGLYSDCIRELYRNNEDHQITLSSKDFVHLFLDDIIFYQRPLKSKKSSISNCTLEYRKYKDDNGNIVIDSLKAIPKSHPLYQEFRLWQWIYNLSIYKREDDTNVTSQFLNSIEDYENLFEYLNTKKEVSQDALMKQLLAKTGLKAKALGAEAAKYRWNFVEDKSYPCNETRAQMLSRLSKVENIPDSFLTFKIEYDLWHIIYSVKDKIEYEKALKSFAIKHGIDEVSFFSNFKKLIFESAYGSFSEKAIKKLLPLMRIGKYWSWDAIDSKVKDRIKHIITAEDNNSIRVIVREKASKNKLEQEYDFQGLQLWLASYVVYDRHSEAANISKWNSIQDLENYLKEFRQHSLRNPIVEQVITETLRVVKDIWQSTQYGNGVQCFFDEIHVELGREMKNTADDRKRMTTLVTENENTNLRIKALLAELKSDGNIENVRPYSPSQLEILKIYEDGVLNSIVDIDDDILKISKTAQPSKSELQRYKLWLEQGYRSPYTGNVIPLNKLFTSDYEIEHVIPQSRFFDDSYSNKVICESAVNKLKNNQLGLEFIKNHHGQIVELGYGERVKIFEQSEYEYFVKQYYINNQSRSKRNKLLMDEVPEKMVERQLNDTRYISKFITTILSNLVRSETNDDGINSKNVFPGNGKITSILKQDWGLNDVWNELILPRFERMNQLTNSTLFTSYNEKHQKHLPTVPLDLSKGFQKKRIDHRHHAMDALVIACASRSHVNYLNNQNALDKTKTLKEKQESREDLKRILCDKTKPDTNGNYQWVFKKPWNNFTVDSREKLESIVVSFKQNLRVINKTTNKYESYKDENGQIRIGEDGKPKKGFIQQSKGDSWAIRKPMHQETVAGIVKLRKEKQVSLSLAIDDVENIKEKTLRVKVKQLFSEGLDKKNVVKYFKDLENKFDNKDVSKVAIYFWEIDERGIGTNVASRVFLDTSFTIQKIDSITDSGIQKILLNHLENYKGRFDEKGNNIAAELLAFTPEGIEEMNKNIIKLNKGKHHEPIYKVRTYEPIGNKFNVGTSGNKKDKFVIAAKGTNLFFAVYWDEVKQKRNYETIPLNEVIEHQKWRATLPKEEQKSTPMIPVNISNGRFLFSLSPNDLVYVPDQLDSTDIKPSTVYKVVSFTGSECHFIHHSVASLIKAYDSKSKTGEFGSLNKQETSQEILNPKRIKEFCFKLLIDRVGNIMS